MAVLYVTEMDAVLRKDHEMLVVSRNGERLARVPLPQVEQVVLLGPVSISTQVLTHFLVNGTDCVFCSAQGQYYGRLVAGESSYGALRIAQARAAEDSVQRLEVARAMIFGKTKNYTTLIRRWARGRRDIALAHVIDTLERLAARLDRARDIGQLRGFEGEATRAYYQGYRAVLRNRMGFDRRARRPPPDPVNSMLSLGYMLLAEATRSALQTAGLDPYLGLMHTAQRSRPSLALDLMEEFRPLIVDSTVLRLVNTREIRPEHFEPAEQRKGVRLAPDGLRMFLAAYEKRMQTLVLHPAVGRIPYRRTLDWQARRLAWLSEGRVQSYEAFTVR